MAFFKLKQELLEKHIAETKLTSILNPKRRSTTKNPNSIVCQVLFYQTDPPKVQIGARNYEDVQRERREQEMWEAQIEKEKWQEWAMREAEDEQDSKNTEKALCFIFICFLLYCLVMMIRP